jgi:hypothetical protein
MMFTLNITTINLLSTYSVLAMVPGALHACLSRTPLLTLAMRFLCWWVSWLGFTNIYQEVTIAQTTLEVAMVCI